MGSIPSGRMGKRALLLLTLLLGCATAPPYGSAAWAQQRYEGATRYCENEYRKQWREYLTGLEFLSPEYAACLQRAKLDYRQDLQTLKGS